MLSCLLTIGVKTEMYRNRHITVTRAFSTVIFLMLMQGLQCSAATEYMLNGLGSYSAFSGKNDDYIVALHTSKPASDVSSILNNPLRLEIIITSPTFLSVMLRKSWYESVLVNSSSSALEKHLDSVDKMLNALKIPIAKNDVITFEYNYLEPISLKLNSETLWEFDQKEFFYMMLAPWFGSIPLSKQLKSQLLSAGKGGVDTQYRYLVRRTNRELSNEQKLAVEGNGEFKKALSDNPEPKPTDLPLEPNKPKQPSKVEALSQTLASMPSTEAAAKAIATRNLDNEKQKQMQKEEQKKRLLEEARFKQQIKRFRRYINDIRRFTSKNVVYPPLAMRRNQEGMVVVQVRIDRQGRASDVNIVKSSKSRILDLSAVEAVTKSSPFPSIPKDLNRDDVRLLIPIAFSLSDF